MNESTETPVERLVRAAREFAAAERVLQKTRSGSLRHNAALNALIRDRALLLAAARAVGDE